MTRLLSDLPWPRRTPRLALRPAEATDASAVWAWRRRPEVGEWLSVVPTDEADHRDRWDRGLPDSLVVLLNERVVGTAKVAVQDAWGQDEVAHLAAGSIAELGWVLDPEFHGRGYGTEVARELLAIAFDGLGVRRVVAHCFADNVASWRIMARIGMRRETLAVKESLHRSGRWLDSMTWAMLAEEYRP